MRRVSLAGAARAGLVAGGVALYLFLVGLFASFNDRDIVAGLLTLAWVALASVPLVAGHVVARGAALPAAAARGALAGLVGGCLAAAFVLVASTVNLRPVFVHASPALVDVLTFERGAATGVAVLVVGGLVLGALGATVAALPAAVRRPLLVAVTTTLLVALLEPLLRVMLAGLDVPTAWLYRRGGVTVTGMVTTLVVAAATSAAWRSARPAVAARVARLDDRPRATVRRTGQLVTLAVLLVLPLVVGPFLSEVAGTVGLFVLLGLGLNVVVGYAGMLHLGYVAFFAVAAYVTALMTSPASSLGFEVSFWAALPVVIVVTTVVGVIVGAPVLRLRGDYLAIVTLAFGEIARILVLSDWLRPALGGAQGILQIPPPQLGGLTFRDPQRLYYLILVTCAIVAVMSRRLEDSRIGRAWTAMREDEQVAELMGVSVTRYKLLAFAVGAGMGSLAGAFFAVKIGSVFPHSFSILVSITALAVVILGGIASLPGIVLGAVVLVGLPDLLREFGEYRLLLYGALVVAIMVLRPQGLLPNVRRMRELAEEERTQDQWLRRAGEGDRTPAIVAGNEGEA